MDATETCRTASWVFSDQRVCTVVRLQVYIRTCTTPGMWVADIFVAQQRPEPQRRILKMLWSSNPFFFFLLFSSNGHSVKTFKKSSGFYVLVS